jgi:hypothetical protein
MRATVLCGVLACLSAGCGGGEGGVANKPAWTVDGLRARYADPAEKQRYKTSAGKPSPDLLTIEVSSEADELHVTAGFNDPWDACFDTEALGDVVLECWIDTDSNAATGGVLLGGTAKGFELYLKPVVGPEIDFTQTPARLTGFSGSYGLTFLRQDEDEFAAGRRTTVDDLKAAKVRMDDSKARCNVQGSELRFTVPYALLNVRSGQTLRMVVMERYGSIFSADSLFPELTLKLR